MSAPIEFLALLTVAANIFVGGVVALAIGGRLSPAVAGFAREGRDWLAPAAIPLAWVVAVVATAGSLYLSEGAGFTPCTLCWYQRIGMYPLAVVLGIAAVTRDVRVRRYVIPVAAAAALISIYHYQLQRFPGQGHLACALDAPCTTTWVWRYSYISIPFMALSAFALIITLLAMARAKEEHP